MPPQTWVIIGASRGIGLELAKQLLTRGDQVIAAVRNPTTASQLWQFTGTLKRPGSCIIDECDVTNPLQIDSFVERVGMLAEKGVMVDGIILNAGINIYPNRATEISYSDFALHLHTNTIGPIIIAQKLLNLKQLATRPPEKVVFISSDSGSTGLFREHEDGFGAYGATKAALNQMLRHMAAELKRRGGVWQRVCILAMHPGEVATDMAANAELGWEVEGTISPTESVQGVLKVIAEKDYHDTGTFWCWDGREHPW